MFQLRSSKLKMITIDSPAASRNRRAARNQISRRPLLLLELTYSIAMDENKA